jgi:seryl-tRNA synthetase
MARSKKVASLIEKKREISKEIENLQNKCNHLNKSLRSTKEHEASSTFVFRWICDDCERVVGIPSEQEIKKYLNGSR